MRHSLQLSDILTEDIKTELSLETRDGRTAWQKFQFNAGFLFLLNLCVCVYTCAFVPLFCVLQQ